MGDNWHLCLVEDHISQIRECSANLSRRNNLIKTSLSIWCLAFLGEFLFYKVHLILKADWKYDSLFLIQSCLVTLIVLFTHFRFFLLELFYVTFQFHFLLPGRRKIRRKNLSEHRHFTYIYIFKKTLKISFNIWYKLTHHIILYLVCTFFICSSCLLIFSGYQSNRNSKEM